MTELMHSHDTIPKMSVPHFTGRRQRRASKLLQPASHVCRGVWLSGVNYGARKALLWEKKQKQKQKTHPSALRFFSISDGGRTHSRPLCITLFVFVCLRERGKREKKNNSSGWCWGKKRIKCREVVVVGVGREEVGGERTAWRTQYETDGGRERAGERERERLSLESVKTIMQTDTLEMRCRLPWQQALGWLEEVVVVVEGERVGWGGGGDAGKG